MKDRVGTPGRRVPRTALPYVVLGVALALTAAGTAYVTMSVRARDRLRFEAAVNRVEERIGARLSTYTAMLRATGGLFVSRWPVLPKEFEAYSAQLDLRRNYPGIFGIGFVVRFEPEYTANFEAFMRNAMGYGDYRVWPETDQEDRTAIVYLEPMDERNAKAIGFDMFTEATRREAMRRARDGGEAAASGRVVLVQDEGDADATTGFLIYLPVYEGGLMPEAVADRRAKTKGYVYAPFRSADLFGDVFDEEVGSDLEVRIYDGTERDPAQLLYQTEDADPAAMDVALRSVTTVDVAGREWTVVMAAGPGFYWWPARYMPVAAGVGGVLLSGMLFGLVRGQVRGRLRAERITADLRESQQALKRSEGKFRRLMDANIVGVAFSRTDGSISDANEEFARIIGRPAEDVRRGGVRWDEITPPEWLAADERAIVQLRERGVCTPFEKEYVLPDGSRVPVILAVAMLEGSTTDMVGVVVDLTAIKRAQRELQEAKESAEAANRLKDEFLATVSHELRTPLNAILGWAQLLAGEGMGPDDVRQGVETILRNARVQAQLIEDLLDISRIVSGKLRLEARSVELAGVVRAAIGSVALAAEAKGVRLVDEVGPEPATVWGDPGRLQQVFWNLLTNAIKFTDRGGTIRVTLGQEGGYARVAVQDTGAGIDPAFVPYVFERFRQADGSLTRKHGGLGLGLSIVRNLVEMHGGVVRVDSEGVGRGATFTVTLPVRQGSPPARTRGGGGVQGAEVSLQGLKVLVVDDEEDARELVRQILASKRAQVVTVDSAARAMEVLEQEDVRVMVSDLAMPEGDGFELIRRVREAGAAVPAVALSALTRAEERERALAAGYQVHLPKPVDAGQLVGVVAELGKR